MTESSLKYRDRVDRRLQRETAEPSVGRRRRHRLDPGCGDPRRDPRARPGLTRGTDGRSIPRSAHRTQAAHPEAVVNARGLGLMTAIEFDTKQRREDVIDAALQRGLLTLGCGHTTLRLLPPLDVRERELDIAVDLLDDAIEDVAADATPSRAD
ncbi:aminotransferase class III-fold pyridoxal phosphate-dependent enzyme [Halopenitus sp. POP-27]|uniref:aminotransferase class III-fold pyridoxal phosphate-dependent enzyme n=1 Tax=Halopenitus sp. POP-27 TaxID=2994425 RepID=UPI002AA2AEB8|nr:aminotransferase class III-fold pyridoxal phosphate-dependent enzyme [Halopenitus sp. POP-27]